MKIRVWRILLQEVDIFCHKMKAWSREMLYDNHDDHVVYPLTSRNILFILFIDKMADHYSSLRSMSIAIVHACTCIYNWIALEENMFVL